MSDIVMALNKNGSERDIPCLCHGNMVCPENAVFLGVTPCGSCKNGRFGGTHRLHQDEGNQRASNNVSSNLELKHAAKKY
jgi:hypothetical protein